METVRRWILKWLRVHPELYALDCDIVDLMNSKLAMRDEIAAVRKENDELARFIKHELAEIRKDMVRFTLETYSPPKPEDRTPKVKKTRTFKEFSDTLEQNFEAEEARSAER